MLIRTPLFKRVIYVGLLVAAARIGVLWYLFVRHAMGRESLEEILLILLLYPEGLFFPRDWQATLIRTIGVSGVLLVGSLIITAIVAATLRVAGALMRSKPNES